MMSWIKKHPIVFLVIIFNIFLLLILLIIFVIQNSKSALVDVIVTPIDSIITIDNQNVENFQTQKMTPGTYTAQISKEGFETKKIELNLKPNETNKLHIYLTGGRNNFDYYKKHPDDEKILEKIQDDLSRPFIDWYQQRQQTYQRIEKQLPIAYSGTKLDPTYRMFVIEKDKRGQCPDFCLKVTDYFGDNYDFIKQYLKNLGLENDDYELNYNKDSS